MAAPSTARKTTSRKPRSTANNRGNLPERELCLRMFRTMVLHRALEDRMVSMYRQGELLGSLYTGHWHEAIAVGTVAALRQDDFLCPLHRDVGAHLWRGMEPWQIMASFLGKATAPTGGRDGTLHYGRLDLNIYNPPSHIPDNFPVATGGAFAATYRGQDLVALAYCGDGSTGRGDFHEALNIAAVMNLPCIFVVENNQFSYSTPLALTSKTDFATKAAAYGMPGEKVDGVDVIAVYDATVRAVERARAGEGPTLIEAVTMRMHGHAEHDPADYVPKQLFDEWAQRDPVELFSTLLHERGIADADEIQAIKDECREVCLQARKKALADPMPDPSTVEVGVYAD
ncbi:thiamine pyrophosphate-dependent dehydrogenase E1 component subunit alpha [Mycolicibacterium sp.]|uniref:thiamine pyrophosphate-dependent dehydrogenase E1 component subunit alpha n=1 Tax=Mycolicibacterium sp. TaxID=2320850 RepID=UPI0037C6CDC9